MSAQQVDEEFVEEDLFEASTDVPPVQQGLMVSVYKNSDPTEELLTSGLPVIHFETQTHEDTHQPWYHNGINRKSAESLLESQAPVTFIVR